MPSIGARSRLRGAAAVAAKPPGQYRLFVRNVVGYYELAPIGLPTNVYVQVVPHRTDSPTLKEGTTR